MKNYIKIIIILFISSPIISCQKRKLNRSTTSSQDNAIAEIGFNDLFKVTEDVMKNEGLEKSNSSIFSNCATVTISPPFPDSTFPKSISIDFGPTNCSDIYGVERRGLITATCSGKFRDPGTSISIITNNYYVNNYKIEGTKTITNEGVNNLGNTYFSINIDDGIITYPNGDITKYESNRIREWVMGEDTDGILGIFDDEYDITGTASGINRDNRLYTVTITSALRATMFCKWIKQGVLEIQPENLYTRIVDFGNGSCDAEAMVEINENVYTITMP